MIVVDTSALVAILTIEPEAEMFARTIIAASETVLSTGTALELSMVAGHKLGRDGRERATKLLEELGVAALQFDERQCEIAIDAYATYGRGSGHPAKLNYGDCFSYALARALDAPLLFKGDDFARTDIRPALAA